MTSIAGVVEESLAGLLVQQDAIEQVDDGDPEDGAEQREHDQHELWMPDIAISVAQRNRGHELSILSLLTMVQLGWLSLLTLELFSLVR